VVDLEAMEDGSDAETTSGYTVYDCGKTFGIGGHNLQRHKGRDCRSPFSQEETRQIIERERDENMHG
jgi:hypothetical protein